MERQIGEVYNDRTDRNRSVSLQVKESEIKSCDGCFYRHQHCNRMNVWNYHGECKADKRKDGKNVIFVKQK